MVGEYLLFSYKSSNKKGDNRLVADTKACLDGKQCYEIVEMQHDIDFAELDACVANPPLLP